MAHDHAEPQASCSKTSSLLLRPAASIPSTLACPAQTHTPAASSCNTRRAPSYLVLPLSLVLPFISRPVFISSCPLYLGLPPHATWGMCLCPWCRRHLCALRISNPMHDPKIAQWRAVELCGPAHYRCVLLQSHIGPLWPLVPLETPFRNCLLVCSRRTSLQMPRARVRRLGARAESIAAPQQLWPALHLVSCLGEDEVVFFDPSMHPSRLGCRSRLLCGATLLCTGTKRSIPGISAQWPPQTRQEIANLVSPLLPSL